jgi:carbamate kinase
MELRIGVFVSKKKVVIALGGNAINKAGEVGTIAEEFKNTRAALNGVIDVIRNGYQVILTHGNGPQVGNFLIRVESGIEKSIPDRPLGVLVADTAGGIGYMIEQSLQNRLRQEGIDLEVVTILSQVIVDPNDPQLKNPSKPIGPFYTNTAAAELIKNRNWQMMEDSGRGWRRLVPSPYPHKIVEKRVISSLVDNEVIVITCGGGGIPIVVNEDGFYEGLDAVIDKDFASSLLANEIAAETLVIATGVEKVAINFGKENQVNLSHISINDCKKMIMEEQFGKGSMLPKIDAAIRFIEKGGERVIITLPEKISEALEGKTGTIITD